MRSVTAVIRLAALGLAGLMLSLSAGCTPGQNEGWAAVFGRGRASLAADSLSDRPGQLWPAGPQHVHVGETVEFDLRVKPAIDDYAVFDFPDRSAVVQANDVYEGYRVRYTFETATPADRPIEVRAAAYRIRGRQDLMEFAGEPMRSPLPGDPADQRLGKASIELIVYQSQVQFEITPPLLAEQGLGRPDWDKTTLRLLADGGKRTSDKIGMGQGGGEGFVVLGPGPDAGWTVRYRPAAAQVSRGGTTMAELIVIDQAGRLAAFRKEFDTP